MMIIAKGRTPCRLLADFVAEVGDDGGEGRERGLLMVWPAICCTGSGQLLPLPLGYAGPNAKHSCAAGGGRTKSLASRLRF